MRCPLHVAGGSSASKQLESDKVSRKAGMPASRRRPSSLEPHTHHQDRTRAQAQEAAGILGPSSGEEAPILLAPEGGARHVQLNEYGKWVQPDERCGVHPLVSP